MVWEPAHWGLPQVYREVTRPLPEPDVGTHMEQRGHYHHIPLPQELVGQPIGYSQIVQLLRGAL